MSISKEDAMKQWFARQMGKQEVKIEELPTIAETKKQEFTEKNDVIEIKNIYMKLAADKVGGILKLSKLIKISQPHINQIIYGKKDLSPELKEKVEWAMNNYHKFAIKTSEEK